MTSEFFSSRSLWQGRPFSFLANLFVGPSRRRSREKKKEILHPPRIFRRENSSLCPRKSFRRFERRLQSEALVSFPIGRSSHRNAESKTLPFFVPTRPDGSRLAAGRFPGCGSSKAAQKGDKGRPEARSSSRNWRLSALREVRSNANPQGLEVSRRLRPSLRRVLVLRALQRTRRRDPLPRGIGKTGSRRVATASKVSRRGRLAGLGFKIGVVEAERQGGERAPLSRLRHARLRFETFGSRMKRKPRAIPSAVRDLLFWKP